MKRIKLLGACAAVAAGVVMSSFGAIQVAGTLQVDVDAVGQPVGSFTYLTNSGAMGGVFLSNNNGVAGVTPLIIALGGNGTHGVLLDGNQISLRHYTDISGATVMLPPAGLTGPNPVFSVEAWMYKATINDETGPVSWGTRSAGQEVSCNWGRNVNWGGFSWYGGGYDYGWNSVPTAGTWHHLVWTYDGAGNLMLYRDGVLDRAATQTSVLNVNATYNIMLGLQHAGTGMFGYAAGVLGRVRIHDGVLTPSQVADNYAYEVASFTNGTPAAVLAGAPLHRYSFNLPAAANAIGLMVPDTGTAAGAAAIIQGTTLASAAIPSFDGEQLVLPAYGGGGNYSTNGYVDLPNGLLSSLSSSNGGPGQVSFELWVNVTAASTWAELMYMGNSTIGEITGPGAPGGYAGANGVVLPAQVGGNAEQSGWRGIAGDRTIGARLIGSRKHIVVTWDEWNDLIKIYHEGVQVGQFAANAKMNAVVDVNDWLGRSGWQDPNCPANYREFRMYGRLLSDAEIRRDYLLGPYNAQDTSTLVWNGNMGGAWDTTTYNWLAGATPINYTNGSSVMFDDTAEGTTGITLAGSVQPKNPVTVVNSVKSYSFSGAGKISGPIGLTKSGTGTLTMALAQNDYTGPTVLQNGTLIVTDLANGGLPSPIGAGSSDPTNLVFAGGTLSYQGPATTVNRGYFVTGLPTTLDLQSDLRISGAVMANNLSGFVKTGLGTLTYSTVGSNLLSGGGFPGFNVAKGTVVFDGTAGPQTNRSMNEFWVGTTAANGANLVVSSSTLLVDSWLSVGRGNGSSGNLSTLTLDNGNIIAGNATMGYAAGTTDNRANQTVTLNGASAYYSGGSMTVGESAGSSGALYINDSSWVRGNPTRLGLNGGATGTVVIAQSGALTNSGWLSIGTGTGTNYVGSGGVGYMQIKDNGVFSHSGDFNVSDLPNSVGRLDVSDNATVLINGTMYIGKDDGTVATINQYSGTMLKYGGGDVIIGGRNTAAATSVATWNMNGGTLSINGNFQPGAYGQGTFNQTGGATTIGGWTAIGRYAGGIGEANLSGGSFNSTNTGTDLIVGEVGIGTLTVSGTATVNIGNQLRLGNAATASGTVNLDGGSITTRRVFMVDGSSLFYFNGGTLQAGPDAASDFMSGLSGAYVSAGGAIIDSAGNDITIAQDLYDAGGGGGLTKLGAGTLSLSGYPYYAGPTVVSAGKLATSTRASSTANITVADGAELSVQVVDQAGSAINPANLTLGSSSGATVTVGWGSFGNPANAPINVTGTLTANGPITVNVDPTSYCSATGPVPLISYVAPVAGSGNFVLGTLPPGVFANLVNDGAGLIYLDITSIKLPRWEGLPGGTWDIEVSANWIDQATGLPDYFYQGSRPTFDDQAQGTTSVDLVTTVMPSGVVVSNSVLDYTFAGVGRITGGGGLTKLGTASLTVSTTNNTYSGMTLIDEGGTLVSTVANNLGANSALVISDASTLSLGANNQSFSTVTLTNGNIVASGATVTAPSLNLDNGSVGAVLAGGTLTTFGTNTDLVSVQGGNTYTGRTVLAGSTLAVPNLANGGLPSGVGSSPPDPTNLVFAGGTLRYTGPATTIDRGYSLSGGGTLSVSGDLNLVGQVAPGNGTFRKSGPATLTYSRLDTNVLTTGSYYIGQGTVLFNGGASTPDNYLQTNRIVGEMWVGYDQANAGALILTNTSLGISSWLAIDRGNGIIGSSSKATLYDSVLTANNFSMGYDAGISGNSSFPVLNLLGNSSLTSAGQCLLGESVGAEANILVAGTSKFTLTGGWLSIGVAGTASMVLSNQATVTAPGDYNLGDITDGDGTLDMYDNTTNLARTLYVGKGANSFGVVNQWGGYMGKSTSGGGDWRIANNATATGTYNLLDGLFETPNNFQIGAYGLGAWNQSGGIANCGNYPVVGRFAGAAGTMVVSGGSFTQTGTGQLLIIGEEGTGTLTISGTGLVNSLGGVSIGHTVTGNGTVNLNGGTLRAPRVFQAGGVGASSILNFNGGVLMAGADNANFLAGLTTANVMAGGAVIDSSSNSVTIAQDLLDSGGGGLTKLGTGTLTLSGANTHMGMTTVSNGLLVVDGSIAGPATVRADAALAGNGVVNGTLTVQANGAISAGPGFGIGSLTLNASPVLGGIVLADVDRNGGSPLADLITVAGNPIAYGGILAVTNTGADLVVGDTFKLFQATSYSGGFTLFSLTPRQVVTWNTVNLTVNGTITVATAVPAFPSTPTNIVGVVVGGNLELSWPADYTGWILQGQTNALSVGLSNNWATVPGSTSTNRMVIPIDPANPTVFFRLAHP